jgi:hypothetical protein
MHGQGPDQLTFIETWERAMRSERELAWSLVEATSKWFTATDRIHGWTHTFDVNANPRPGASFPGSADVRNRTSTATPPRRRSDCRHRPRRYAPPTTTVRSVGPFGQVVRSARGERKWGRGRRPRPDRISPDVRHTRAAEALPPGKRLTIKYPNVPHRTAHTRPDGERRSDGNFSNSCWRYSVGLIY